MLTKKQKLEKAEFLRRKMTINRIATNNADNVFSFLLNIWDELIDHDGVEAFILSDKNMEKSDAKYELEKKLRDDHGAKEFVY